MKEPEQNQYKNDGYDDDNIPEIDLPKTVRSVDVIQNDSAQQKDSTPISY